MRATGKNKVAPFFPDTVYSCKMTRTLNVTFSRQ